MVRQYLAMVDAVTLAPDPEFGRECRAIGAADLRVRLVITFPRAIVLKSGDKGLFSPNFGSNLHHADLTKFYPIVLVITLVVRRTEDSRTRTRSRPRCEGIQGRHPKRQRGPQ